MTRNNIALCLLMGPIAVALLAAGGESGKAGVLPTSVDDRICPSPWIGAKPASAAWYASGICGTVASDSRAFAERRSETESSTSTAANSGTHASRNGQQDVYSQNSSAGYASASAASPRADDVGTSATEAELEAAGCPPDFLYVYGPCEHEDDFDKPIGQARVLAAAEWSNQADHGYCYDPRLLDNGTWYDPYAWLNPDPAKIVSVRVYGPQAPQKRRVIQGDLSWLVEECLCNSRHDLGLQINLENDGLTNQTAPWRRVTLAAHLPAGKPLDPAGFETVIDGPDRYLFVRRADAETAAEFESGVAPHLARRTGKRHDEKQPASEPNQRLLTVASNILRAAGQIALDVSMALEKLDREVATDDERAGDAIPHTAASPANRSAGRVTPHHGL